ncbi:MAG: hypothetical protein IT454_00660 [Planctomycetes bacterium]|nr:hypothetical protein [Planctomycetota bacterium]
MQIHRVRGRDLRDALQRAGLQYGKDALLLSHETMPDGGVTVAVADPDRATAVRLLGAVRSERRDPGLDDIERVMQRNGCSTELIEATLAQVQRSGARGSYALDAAAAVLGRSVQVAPSPKIHKRGAAALAQPCVIAFVGATGVGKTTTLAKLAARLVRVGRRVGIVSMDTLRPGAIEQLRALAADLEVRVEVARDGVELARIVAAFAGCDCVLIDTTGRSPHDAQALDQLARVLTGAGSALETYLVVPASASQAAIDDARAGFASARPTAWVITKLDETREPAAVLESASHCGARIAFLCDGPSIQEHLHRADAERFADLFMRGRIA